MRYLLKVIYFIVFTAVISGCDNTMDPFDEEKGLYSIYGYLDLNEEVNYIRVKDLNKPLPTDSTDTIDATVILENLNNNTKEILQDTLVQFNDIYTHNFRTAMEITPGTSYQITVERSDGKSVTATATTPHVADVSLEPTGQDCITPIEMTFKPVSGRYDLDLSIGFDYNEIRYWVSPDADHFEEELVIFRFTPLNILDKIFYPPGPDSERVWCHMLDHDNLFVRYTHYGPDFEDTGSDSLDIPGETVKFGALYEDSFSFPIDLVQICPPLCL